ncbi:MAG TPA: class I SAM-dependent methyltransferase [Arthrobacter sp.]|nr:class I SAM-dependent methyltransferase [Arthrobacter sp.]
MAQHSLHQNDVHADHDHGHHGDHTYDHGHGHGHGHDHATSGLADLLDLDAEVLGSYLDEVTEWAGKYAPDTARTVVDMGAGTGTGSLALARRFSEAEVIAIDKSESMLERIRTAADGQGLGDRVSAMQADVDAGWPALGAVDLVWAASSLHEVADPGKVLQDIYTALQPGGLLVVVEMDSLPRFLPDDVGMGRAGLESRCHEVLAESGWNAHPNWRSHLEQAGFEISAERSFTTEAGSASSGTRRYAHKYLQHIRTGVEGKLGADDLEVLDRLLADGTAESLLHRGDLNLRVTRTAWAARRP